MDKTISPPMVSVVMSVYNAEEYLQRAIDSILSQSFSDFELIVIEDSSTDHSLKILEDYARKDSRIHLIKKEKNNGAVGFVQNLNDGVKIARGKYIARMDADDIAFESRFEKQVSFLENNPNVSIVGASIELIDENDHPLKIWKALTRHKEIVKQMPNNIALFHPVIMFRKDLAIRYREKARYCEDYDLYFNAIISGKQLANIDEVLLQYRILEGSASRQNSKFIRWLFVEKIRLFYKNKLNNKKDGYEDFEPNDYLNILDINYPNHKTDLLFAIKCALKFNNISEGQIILKKIKDQYPAQSLGIYNVVWQLPPIIKKLLLKII